MHDASSSSSMRVIPFDVDPLSRPLPSRTDVLLSWFRGQPLVAPALGLSTGIAIDAACSPPFIAAVVIFLVAGLFIFYRRSQDSLRLIAVFIAAIAVGAPLHDLSFRHLPRNHIMLYSSCTPISVQLTGTVIDTPNILQVHTGRISWFPQAPHTQFFLSAESIETKAGPMPVSGIVTVSIHEPLMNVAVGDRVQALGSLYRPSGRDNPFENDFPLRQRRRGVWVGMSCEHAAHVQTLAGGSGSWQWLDLLRRRARTAMLDRTAPGDVEGIALLEAMVLGQRSAVNNELNDAFVRTGTVHFVSVSGAHVGMLASIVWMVGLLFSCSRRACAFWAMLLLTGYAVMAEPNAAIWRSALMADLFCIALLLRRPLHITNWLALSAIVILALYPTQLFDAGFQLSFFSLIALLFLTPRVRAAFRTLLNHFWYHNEPLLMPEIQRMLNPPSPSRQIFNTFIHVCTSTLAVSIAAWSVSIWLGNYHFRQVAPFGWLNTLFITPIVWLALVIGFLKTVLAVVHPFLGTLLAIPLSRTTDVLIAIVHLLDRLPGTHFSPPRAPLWLVVAALAVLSFWMAAPWLRIRGRWMALLAVSFITLAAWNLAPAASSEQLRLSILSVGRGTTCLIQLPNAKAMLYDVGSSPPYDLERWTLGPLLAHERIYSLDAVIISHPDLDHFSGLPDVLDKWPVRQILTAPHFDALTHDSKPSASLLKDIQQQDIRRQYAQAGAHLANTGQVRIEVLWPPAPDALQIKETNDSSVVLRLTYAGRRILLCGDIAELAERELLKRDDLKADVLVLPHHGSVVAATRAFIDAVNPQYCIRSAGQRDADTRNGLLPLVAGRTYFNTADDGAITVSVTPVTLSVLPFKSRR